MLVSVSSIWPGIVELAGAGAARSEPCFLVGLGLSLRCLGLGLAVRNFKNHSRTFPIPSVDHGQQPNLSGRHNFALCREANGGILTTGRSTGVVC